MATMTTTYGSTVNSVFRAYTSGSYTTSDTQYVFSITGGLNIPTNGYKTTRSFTSTVYVGSTSLGSGSIAAATRYGVLTTAIKTVSYTVTRTHSAQTITFKSILKGSSESTTSTATLASVTVPAKPSYAVTYNANGGSGTTASQTKWYGESLKLQSNSFTKTNYTFQGWATSQANANAGTVNYAAGATYTGNAALTLYAVWKQNYTLPTISSISAIRCDSSGDALDTGTYIKLSFTYLGGSLDGGTSRITPTCNITISDSTGTPTTPTMSNSTTATTVSMIYGNNNGNGITNEFSVNNSYTITVKLFDTNNTTGITKTVTVGAATFPIDILGDGSAMGLMTPAVANQFITVPSLVSTGTITSTKDGSGTSAGMLVSHGIANRDSGFTAKRTDTNTAVSLIVGTGGINHGVWSDKLSKWISHGESNVIYHAGMYNGYIGDSYSNGGTTVSLTANNDAYVTAGTITVPAGSYIIVLYGSFTSESTTAGRRIQLYNVTSSSTIVTFQDREEWWSAHAYVWFSSWSSQVTISCRLSSSVANTASGWITAVKIR